MATAKTFLKLKGNDSFKKTPFCEADILIMTALSYANYKDSFYFKECEDKFINLSIFGKSTLINRLGKNYLALGKTYNNFLVQFFTCERYKDVEVGYFYDYFSTKKEIQFFALSFKIEDKYLVVFRGTDNSIVGWKEDFNMGFLDKIPAQSEARDYAKKMISKFKKNIIISGHSKGGNLAYYSYLNLNKREKSKVLKVYNFDGPGFRVDKYDYSEYGKKLCKIVPEDDVFGILFDESNNLDITQSTRVNLAGHDLLTWKLDSKTGYTSLKRRDELTSYAIAFRETVNHWLNTYDSESIQELVTFVFKFIESNNIKTLGELLKDFIFSGNIYLQTIEDYDEATKVKLKKMVHNLFRIYLKNLLTDRKK